MSSQHGLFLFVCLAFLSSSVAGQVNGPAWSVQRDYNERRQEDNYPGNRKVNGSQVEKDIGAVHEELRQLRVDVDASTNQLNRLDTKFQSAKDQEGKFLTRLEALERELDSLRRLLRNLSLVVGLTGIVLVIYLVILIRDRAAFKIRKRSISSQSHSVAAKRKASREFFGLLRPDMAPEIPLETQERLLEHTRRGGSWQPEWEAKIYRGLQTVIESARPNAESQVAMFLLDFWRPLLACYETDKEKWNWFREKFLAACPAQWQGEVYVPAIVNKYRSEAVGESERILGQGETIKEIMSPGIVLRNAQNVVIEQRKAWAMT